MPDPITTAGAASPDAASADTNSPAARVAAATAILTKVGIPSAAEQPVQEASPPAAKEPPLAEVIRAQREARQAHAQEQSRAKSLEAELKAAKDELAAAKADRQAFEDDPVGYAKARSWTPEQQLLYGQSLLYDIVPDKADPNFRVKMFEDRQKRERAAKERADKDAQAQAAQSAQQEQIHGFIRDVDNATRSFEAGSYPESEAWFGNDRDSYMQSLLATARNVAAAATQQGRVADLSPAALAAALEAETSRRMAERDQRMQARKPKAPAAGPAETALAAASGVQAMDTASTRNMNGAGTPLPPPKNDSERVQRAVAAGFRQR